LKESNGVDQYKNVEVNFINGKKATLTIFKDGKQSEKVNLSEYNDKARLHELFAKKGFKKYSEEEVKSRRQVIQEQSKNNVAKAKQQQSWLRGKNKKNKIKKENETKRENDTKKEKEVKKSALSRYMGVTLSPRLRKKLEERKKLKMLKEERENFMMVGTPRG